MTETKKTKSPEVEYLERQLVRADRREKDLLRNVARLSGEAATEKALRVIDKEGRKNWATYECAWLQEKVRRQSKALQRLEEQNARLKRSRAWALARLFQATRGTVLEAQIGTVVFNSSDSGGVPTWGDERPVLDSLPVFGAERGPIRYNDSPTLVAGGVCAPMAPSYKVAASPLSKKEKKRRQKLANKRPLSETELAELRSLDSRANWSPK